MSLIKVDILASLGTYKRTLYLLSKDIFNSKDDFIIKQINRFIIEEVFDSKLIIGINDIDTYIKTYNKIWCNKFYDFADSVNELFKYTINIDKLENDLPLLMKYLYKSILDDIEFERNQLKNIHKDFNKDPHVELTIYYKAILTYLIKVKNE